MMEEDGQVIDASAEATPDAPIDSAQPALGTLLVAARERLNLSAADLARQLRLALRQVQALEENRFDALPGNTFARGFIRNYARVVQTDAAIFLDAYERSRPQAQQPKIEHSNAHITIQQKTTPKWVWYLMLVIAFLIASPLVIYFVLRDEESPTKTLNANSARKPSPTPAVPSTPMSLPPPQAVLQSNQPSSATATVVTAPLQTIAPEVASAPAPIPKTEATPVAVAGVALLELRFNGDAWVEVRDRSNKIIFSQLSRSGEKQTVQGKPPLALVVGNAIQVRIAYNGKPIDLLAHTKVNVARLTLE